MLFATLDPTLRAIDLPRGSRAILSDTVGFIADLPTMLVAAFRATLEEVIEADIILHVRDMSHEDAVAQSHDVTKVLGELAIDSTDSRLIEVWNKIDRLGADDRARLMNLAERQKLERRPVVVSALTGEGIDQLVRLIQGHLDEKHLMLSLLLDPTDGAGLSWLYRHSEVLSKEMNSEGQLAVTVKADPMNADIVRRKYVVTPVV
jgi:GTP-binding protein HflX